MAENNRPSLDSLVPLMMLEDDNEINNQQNELTCEPPTEILRHFESGDIVLVQLDSQCLPAIVFNINGFVMKFDIDRQLYHVCLLNKDLSEHWIDALDMAIYSVPMIVNCDDEQIALMWTNANELLRISNDNEDKMRFEEFKKRFCEIRQQQLPLSSLNNSNRSKSSRNSTGKSISQPILQCQLTNCEGLHIIESIYQLSQCTYAEAKRTADETYLRIICTNNRENPSSYSIENLPEQWFIHFAIQHVNYFRKYSSIWLPDLETVRDHLQNENPLHSLISLMKQTV